MTARDWDDDAPPDLEAFGALARETFAALPAHFRRLCGNVAIHVADEAEADILKEFGMTNPLELSGLYEGVDLIRAGATEPVALPNHVHLYRRSIIAEWSARGNITLRELVAHVLVHEIGHHFGLSDEDMHAIEAKAD